MKQRKNILIVDNNSEIEQLIKGPLLKHMEHSTVSPIVVRAKDGAEAAIKSENQKFDVVLIDTEVPRLMDGGFVYGLGSYKNTQAASLIVVSDRAATDLPGILQNAKIFTSPLDVTEAIKFIAQALSNENVTEKKSSSSSAPPKFAVDVRVINAVIKATTKVLEQFGVSSIKMEKAIPKPPAEPVMGEISSVVDIKSQSFSGYLCISFDKPSYLEVVSTMLMEEQTDLTPDNQDAVGEINNIIFGNAKSDFTQFGIEMTVPKVFIGAGKTVPCDPGSAGMLIPFSTGKGKFYLSVVAFPTKP